MVQQSGNRWKFGEVDTRRGVDDWVIINSGSRGLDGLQPRPSPNDLRSSLLACDATFSGGGGPHAEVSTDKFGSSLLLSW